MNDNKDISLPVALLLAFGVFILFMGLQFKSNILIAGDWAYLLHEQFSFYLYSFLICLFLNVIILSLYIRRFLTLSKQGARLRNINDAENSKRRYLLGFIFIAVVCNITVESLLNIFSSDIPVFIRQLKYFGWVEQVYSINASMLLSLFCYRAADFLNIFQFSQGNKKRIKTIPKEENQITIGTTQNEDKTEKWITIPQKALNGSILITGSPGSGKTAGAILPFFRQSLTNFNKSSILALDPKRTFIPNAVKIIANHDKDRKVRRLMLDGSESFNPVYMDKALKSSRFVEIAEMVRASAINFSGGKSDSPFWEISAFNLIKNCVIYCAAIKEYFTLKDIYQSMINATSTNLGNDLLEIIERKKSMRRPQQVMPLTMAA